MSHHRLVRWLSRILGFGGANATVMGPVMGQVGPLDLPSWAAWVEAPVQQTNPLAAQLAVTARLNVRSGRTTALRSSAPVRAAKPKPIVVHVVKRAPAARSVHLQARHIAAKPRPARSSNVVTLAVNRQPLPLRKPTAAAAA